MRGRCGAWLLGWAWSVVSSAVLLVVASMVLPEALVALTALLWMAQLVPLEVDERQLTWSGMVMVGALWGRWLVWVTLGAASVLVGAGPLLGWWGRPSLWGCAAAIVAGVLVMAEAWFWRPWVPMIAIVRQGPPAADVAAPTPAGPAP